GVRCLPPGGGRGRVLPARRRFRDRCAAARRAALGPGEIRLRVPAPDPEPDGPRRPGARLHGPGRARGAAAGARRAGRATITAPTSKEPPAMAASPPCGLNIRQRTPVSARARQAELPPQLAQYVETRETLGGQ